MLRVEVGAPMATSRGHRGSRRFLLQSLLAFAGNRARADETMPPVKPSEPQPSTGWHKFSKQVAGYVDRGKRGPETCGLCHYFIDPDQCVIVEGPVSAATGWCNYGATTG
jgi:hypothetical protein